MEEQVLSELTNGKREYSIQNKDGTAITFYYIGYDSENENLICTRLIRVDSKKIREMVLRVPKAVNNEDRAYKDFYIMAMESSCGFGSGDELEPFWKFKKKYGL